MVVVMSLANHAKFILAQATVHGPGPAFHFSPAVHGRSTGIQLRDAIAQNLCVQFMGSFCLFGRLLVDQIPTTIIRHRIAGFADHDCCACHIVALLMFPPVLLFLVLLLAVILQLLLWLLWLLVVKLVFSCCWCRCWCCCSCSCFCWSCSPIVLTLWLWFCRCCSLLPVLLL